MKIGIPSETDGGLQATVCQHFGQAPFFTVIDTDTGTAVAHANAGHASGKTPAQQLAELGVKVVLAGGMGAKAIQMLGQLGIEVYLQASGRVADVLTDYQQGKLPAAAEAGPCTDPCPPRG